MNTNNAKKNDPRQKDKCLSCQQQTVNAAISGNAVDQFKLGEMYYWVRIQLIFVLSFILNNATPATPLTVIFTFISSKYHFVFINLIKGEGGLPEDWQEAFIWFERSSIQGYVFAQFHLAYMYFRVRPSLF